MTVWARPGKSFFQKSKIRLASNMTSEAATAHSATGQILVVCHPNKTRRVAASSPMPASRLNHARPWQSAVT